ncbi:hypothetical protein LCGC14_2729830, partial [marine sediment metagenome]
VGNLPALGACSIPDRLHRVTGIAGRNGGMMDGGMMFGMGLWGILVLVVLVLVIAALVKYLRK